MLLATYLVGRRTSRTLRDARLEQLESQIKLTDAVHRQPAQAASIALQAEREQLRPYNDEARARRRCRTNLAEEMVTTTRRTSCATQKTLAAHARGSRPRFDATSRSDTTTSRASTRTQGRLTTQLRPVWPNPPAPRDARGEISRRLRTPPARPARRRAARCARPARPERRRAAVPARDHELPLVVGIDQPDEIAEHDAVLMTEPRARQDHRREPGSSRWIASPVGMSSALPGPSIERRIEAGAQIEAGGARGRVPRQRKFACRCADRGCAPSRRRRSVGACGPRADTDGVHAETLAKPRAAILRAA